MKQSTTVFQLQAEGAETAFKTLMFVIFMVLHGFLTFLTGSPQGPDNELG